MRRSLTKSAIRVPSSLSSGLDPEVLSLNRHRLRCEDLAILLQCTRNPTDVLSDASVRLDSILAVASSLDHLVWRVEALD
ncbi:hypothetical protein PRIPAC_86469 [Pristionchus pacificus]|uniref:Uncharacterized protein n=1 Tax=Pristionchus pacificus TaxID=54126 RepID=A0A2A6BSP9_PRIPA|nr:hypothetical protein PRIPAC_86469 [Pristionchus pacificus]|eukprot:PDM68846.1 hypothetical protein PRIPAC_47148 [Pristionchus pacificus]